MKTLGDKLIYLRKKNNKKQKDLADYLHITIQAYSQYERDLRRPDSVKIKDIANYYNVSTDFILDNNTSNQSIPEKDVEEYLSEIEYTLLHSKAFRINGIIATEDDLLSIINGMRIGLELAKNKH